LVMKLPHPELNPTDTFFGLGSWESSVSQVIFIMDVLRPLPYLAGLLNRMDIKAIAASPSFAMRTRNHEAWETPRNSGVE
jgi:hypothetical protein